MYTYRKPKNAKHAIELVKQADVKVNWDISNPEQPEQSQKYFEMYQPIVFIYKNDELVGAAHAKSARPVIYDLMDRDVTSAYNKLVLKEIDAELKQLELF